jgi:Holliday junction resolvasome RuvABC endonuclease subunit
VSIIEKQGNLNMNILALDCATKTGWALADGNGKIIESGVQDFSKRRGESNGILFMKFRKWLSELIISTEATVIAYERAHFRGGAATEICVGLQTRVQELSAEKELNVLPIHTAELKKFATGRGNADKSEMINIASLIIGRTPQDDNEADAIHLARFAAREVGV